MRKHLLSLIGEDDYEAQRAVEAMFAVLEEQGIYPTRRALRELLMRARQMATDRELPHLEEIEHALNGKFVA